jgi:very-short-patch-repair endonuclease
MVLYNKKLKEIAKNLRNELTEAERCLWKRLRLKHIGYVFYRQKPIGDYIVDFYCPKARLVVEVDGGRHFTKDTASNDKLRDEYMQSLGLAVLRFPNSEVLKNTDRVAEVIYKILLHPPFRKGDKRKGKEGAKLRTKILLHPPLQKGDKRKGYIR